VPPDFCAELRPLFIYVIKEKLFPHLCLAVEAKEATRLAAIYWRDLIKKLSEF
jgi:hypothetical protein